MAKPGEHLLQTQFCYWYMQRKASSKRSHKEPEDYEKRIKQIGEFSTIEGFWKLYNHVLRPNDVSATSTDFHLFRAGIKPIWEDPANKKGGKWIVRLVKGLASRYWEAVILAIIGESIDVGNEICGAVISIRHSEDIIAVWNRNADNRDAVSKIRDSLKELLNIPGFVKVEYKRHDTALQDSSSFRNTQVWRDQQHGNYSRDHRNYRDHRDYRDNRDYRDHGRGHRSGNLPAWANDENGRSQSYSDRNNGSMSARKTGNRDNWNESRYNSYDSRRENSRW
mmetsp:Transcript_11755/g.13531  ORF Transcript_11755/g.13531 Transcript_11755/m.13531 type:complete len:280 (+) Transcript_11755:173-1012(+)|eukprot:CAMPEP_0184020176 /NCGR_PEP_ID=MMETSP0954-20121128/9197_1 /TAXON_ID=627963 /ORGANISM="Aplanochytrium sp, Strain PBS07" /LENGTH=279 /DNA_ID=CAMNT_0026301995 /DNA_START=188 /DNA_END=1024 /DNA_ORIENTATION=+